MKSFKNITYESWINNTIYILLFLSSSSRFLFIDFDSIVVPILIFALSLVGGNNNKFTYLLLLLFSVVDNGGVVYNESPSLVRYSVYIYVLIFVLSNTTLILNKRYFPQFIFLITIPFFLSLSVEYFDFITFKQNVFLIIIFLIIFLKKKKLYQINFKILSISMIAYIIGEYFNIILLGFTLSDGEYLNYNSLKCLIILPSLYAFYKNKKITLLFVIFTIPILIQYGTRLIIIIYLFLLLLLYIKKFDFSLKKIMIFVISISVIIFSSIFFIQQNLTLLSSTKTGSVFYYLFSDKSISYFQLLDPIRYSEFIIFFDRPILNILFGDGLGSGLYDHKGLLSFVTNEMTSFKPSEISNQIFFGFHDVFIDVGLRFGLLFVIYIVVNDLNKAFFKNNFKALISFLIFIVALYSSLGILAFLILNSTSCEEKNSNTSK